MKLATTSTTFACRCRWPWFDGRSDMTYPSVSVQTESCSNRSRRSAYRAAILDAVGHGVEAFAVVFLHSYLNSEHEDRAEAILHEELNGAFVSTSHDVSPEIREYDRTTTTSANAYVQPLVASYLGRLEEGLAQEGVSGQLSLMSSAGGLVSVSAVKDKPIDLLESGPAGAALAAGFFGRLAGENDVIAFDMGGTTAKVCLVDDGTLPTAHSLEVARVHRFKKGSGIPIRAHSIELIEIGAGGGSIARRDRLGLLAVGPESAGASPGPACYGLGGADVTVTDAALLLGYLDAGYFLGGAMPLDTDAARGAVATLAETFDLDPVHVAWGIYEIVTENMARAIRLHAAEQGHDYRKYTIVATGGAGAVHAYRLARILGISRVLCPLRSGVAASVGLLVAAPRVDLLRSYAMSLANADWDRVNELYVEMVSEAHSLLPRLGVSTGNVQLVSMADMRYAGQGFEVTTTLGPAPYGPDSLDMLIECFETEYERLYERRNSAA